MIKYDLHTHTSYCDGENTPDEMVREAVKKGFYALGFSGHAYTPIDEECSMSIEGTKKYLSDIKRLKKEYEGKIKIFLAIEQDYYSSKPDFKCDYKISSVHYLMKNGRVLSVDESKESFLAAIDECYGGDVYSLIEDYYSLVSDVIEKTGGDIIGHFNLVDKFNADDRIFDSKDERCVKAWKKAIDKLVKYSKPFEINTGSISRGYLKEPYPSAEMLRYIKQKGGSVIYSGDTHSAKMLGFGMDIAQNAAFDAKFASLFEKLPLNLE